MGFFFILVYPISLSLGRVIIITQFNMVGLIVTLKLNYSYQSINKTCFFFFVLKTTNINFSVMKHYFLL